MRGWIMVICLCLAACSKGEEHPERVVEALFDAAKNAQYDGLGEMCDPMGKNDRDTRKICSLSDSLDRAAFKNYFAAGSLDGKPLISGDLAKVPVRIGSLGEKPDTIHLVKREGEWFLLKF